MDQPELITQLQLGDESAFTKLVDEYQDMVYNTALGIVQQADDADDITQEVFIQVYQSISSFKGDSKFSTWLYRIAVSKALDHEKKKKRKKRFGFVQSLFGGDGEEQVHPVEFDHPGIQAEKKESAAALFRALKQIPDNQRIVFSLHKLEGQSNREIAAIMNTSLQAVESLMSRAKASLKKELNDYYQKNIT
ncbi:MAG TPA: RNA polymerase sigma factor [Ferruginibacter sp.]|nr:RNA polymerase sigma factor [Chitinophagaceae bacterium]MBK7558238.1 RNA polymerase sigma factor [Chitinophagaceae bacterium]MBK9531940.1 RNA polymerase sigma factor [Chitinophagaceae bacterium]HQW91676.1 RNA polymerase sigma factor [Ferruginibacter sp.]